MPFFDFKCKNCLLKFEELILSEEYPKCPKCGSEVDKLVSACTSRIYYSNAHEMIEREIKDEVRKTVEKIKNGNEDVAADIFGVDE